MIASITDPTIFNPIKISIVQTDKGDIRPEFMSTTDNSTRQNIPDSGTIVRNTLLNTIFILSLYVNFEYIPKVLAQIGQGYK